MSFFSALLKGKQITEVHCDSEVTYLILSNGTLVAVHGLLTVEPDPSRQDHHTGSAIKND